MKKTYIQPQLYMQLVQTERLIALSLIDGEDADDSDALVKGETSGKDAWSSPKNVWDDDWSK